MPSATFPDVGSAETASADVNPFFAPSPLPYGLPPFGAIRDEHFRPAFDAGLAEQLAEIDALLAGGDAPTVENTLVPLELSGQLLSRVSTVFFTLSAADSTPFIDTLEAELAPRLAAHSDAIRLNPALFDRIRTLFNARESEPVAETRYLIERYFAGYVASGAGLGDAEKATLRDLNGRLSTLTTRFEKNVPAEANDLAVVFDDPSELDGLPPEALSATAEAAATRGLAGQHLVTLVLPTGHPYLASLTVPASRERIMAASRARGARSGDHDNRPVALEIARLRSERARLLGFESHAAWVTANQTAGTPEAVHAMLEDLAPVAARNARAEQAALEGLAGHPIDASDWAFYTERVRSATYDIDTAAMRPYFEAERVLYDGVFFAATALYGVTFRERTDLDSYHPEARIFEVSEQDGSPLGLYSFDLYTRASKRGGAWMTSLVSQSTLLGHRPVVTNNLNVPKPAAGESTLLTLDEVTTLFHEFGHALHGLFATVRYPRFAGTRVFRDFVEFPSQVNEMWMLWPEVIANYAVHHETGEPMPTEIVDRVRASAVFNEGFRTSEYLAAALLDQAWHRLAPSDFEGPDAVKDVEAFEAGVLAAVGLDNPAVPPRYSTTYFAHTFAGGYDAGYYSYIWSEVLDADTGEWFAENGGLTRENGDRFRRLVLGVGGSMDPLAAYRAFRGRDARIEPLLTRRGLD